MWSIIVYVWRLIRAADSVDWCLRLRPSDHPIQIHVSPILVGSWQWVVVWPFDWHGGGVPEWLWKHSQLQLYPQSLSQKQTVQQPHGSSSSSNISSSNSSNSNSSSSSGNINWLPFPSLLSSSSSSSSWSSATFATHSVCQAPTQSPIKPTAQQPNNPPSHLPTPINNFH